MKIDTRITVTRSAPLPVVLFVMLLFGIVLTGCGGATSNGSIAAGTGKATFTISWPSVSRLIPTASNSILIVITNASVSVASKVLARPVGGGVATLTFDALPIGTLTVTATAQPQTNGSGVAQATATSPLVIQANQNTPFSLTMASTIDHLELTAATAQVSVGHTDQLSVAAKDASGAVVLLAPSQLLWASQNTSLVTVDTNGLTTGVAVGTPTLSVTDPESGKSATFVLTVVQPAAPILYDGFAYTAGQGLSGQNGGSGNWGGGWNEYGQGNTSSVIQTGSLQFGSLATGGNAIMTTSDYPLGHARAFGTPLTLGTSGTTLYISYLVKPLDALNAGYPNTYYGLAFGGYSLGKAGGTDYYGIQNGSVGGVTDSTTKAVTGQTAFLVGRFTFHDGSDTLDLWVNPTPGQPLPTTPDVTQTTRDTGLPADFNIGSSIRCVFDEIRFGTTWEEVSPVQ